MLDHRWAQAKPSKRTPSGLRTQLRIRAMGVTAGLLVIAVVSGSCSAPGATSPTSDSGVKISTSTPPGARAKQSMDMLNSDTPIGQSGVETLAAADMVPSVKQQLEYLWWDRPYKATGVDYYAGKIVLHLVNSFGATQDVEIHTDEAGLVNQFKYQLVDPKINSWSDVDAELAKSNARYSYQVAKVNGGHCDRVAGANTSEPLPLASIFKLYVLYAVADAVRAGTLSWDDELTVTSRETAVEFPWLPEYPLGAKVSVRAAAEKMISNSYNSATDLLIARVGTPAVERALVAAGHHDPQSMTPFPTMYELFSIGWGKPDLRQQWKDAVATGSPQARAQLLDQVNALPYQNDPDRAHTPASQYGVEWYGTAEDICRVHAALQTGALGPAAPVKQIMSVVSGIDLDKQRWPYIAAKGGSLPGDVTFSWYAVNRSGQAWIVSFQLNWPRYHGLTAWSWVIAIARQVFAMADKQSER